MSINNSNNAKGFLFGFLAGGAVGAIVALLTTPKSGKEFRGEIKQKPGEYFDEADKYYQEKKNKAVEIFNEGKRKYNEIVNNVKSKPEEIPKDDENVFNDTNIKTKNILHTGKEKLETETDKLKSSIKTGMNAYNEYK